MYAKVVDGNQRKVAHVTGQGTPGRDITVTPSFTRTQAAQVSICIDSLFMFIVVAPT